MVLCNWNRINPDTQGENSGRLKIYNGNPIKDPVPLKQRIFFKDITKLIRDSFAGNSMPEELKEYFTNPPPGIQSSQFKEILKKYEGSFKPGTIEKYGGLVKKMLAPSLEVTGRFDSFLWDI